MTDERIEYEFDNKLFIGDVKRALTERRGRTPSLRDIERATGVSISTINRIHQGIGQPDLASFLQICGAMQLSPCAYFKQVVWRRIEE